ncbi:DNA polymerase V subunit UmuC, partial [Escherichia coli]|nr:DNA polymerase V subunit UmuC [Escherichia coli]
VRELRGEACFSLEESPPAKQQIVVSRSFGQRVEALADMQQAITGFAARAAEKLRGERQYCRVINVFIRTSPYSVRDTQYANQATEKLTVATQDSRTIIQAAQTALARIWREDIA